MEVRARFLTSAEKEKPTHALSLKAFVLIPFWVSLRHWLYNTNESGLMTRKGSSVENPLIKSSPHAVENFEISGMNLPTPGCFAFMNVCASYE
jgi:hypothetical protein